MRSVKRAAQFSLIGWLNLVLISLLLVAWSDAPTDRGLLTTHANARTTRLQMMSPTEDEILSIARSFLAENRSKQFRYMRASSFTVGQSQPGSFNPPPLGKFVNNVNELRGGQGCQVEVLGILKREGLRWVCADGKHGRTIIHEADPFALAGGDLLFSVVQPVGGKPPGFKAYVLSGHPAIDAVRQALIELKSIDDTIDWRIIVVKQPWYHMDESFSSRNPNLLLYPQPSKSIIDFGTVMNGLYWARKKTISVREDATVNAAKRPE